MGELLSGAIEVVTTLSSAIIDFYTKQMENPVIMLIMGVVLFVMFLDIIFITVKRIGRSERESHYMVNEDGSIMLEREDGTWDVYE